MATGQLLVLVYNQQPVINSVGPMAKEFHYPEYLIDRNQKIVGYLLTIPI